MWLRYWLRAVNVASGDATPAEHTSFQASVRHVMREAALIEWDSFHRYEREEMHRLVDADEQIGG